MRVFAEGTKLYLENQLVCDARRLRYLMKDDPDLWLRLFWTDDIREEQLIPYEPSSVDKRYGKVYRAYLPNFDTSCWHRLTQDDLLVLAVERKLMMGEGGQ